MSVGSFHGDDSPPLMSKVPDPPPSHWGVTLTDRCKSPEYLRFFFKAKAENIRKEAEHGKRRT